MRFHGYPSPPSPRDIRFLLPPIFLLVRFLPPISFDASFLQHVPVIFGSLLLVLESWFPLIVFVPVHPFSPSPAIFYSSARFFRFCLALSFSLFLVILLPPVTLSPPFPRYREPTTSLDVSPFWLSTFSLASIRLYFSRLFSPFSRDPQCEESFLPPMPSTTSFSRFFFDTVF